MREVAWQAMSEATNNEGRLRFTALVSGDVQGVGYRAFVKSNAADLGVAGTVENLADGRVEVVAEGFEPDLEVLLVRMNNGTAHSEVTNVEVEWGQAGGLKGFYDY